jgi:dTMP kinase
MPARRKKTGLFVTFEGIDGCGKTTQLNMSYRHLRSLGHDVVRLREPGSTPTAEKIRRLLLDRNSQLADVTELLLYEAARAEITRTEIVPHLKAGRVVLCDRFYDSTTAYQGYGRGLDLRSVKRLHTLAVGDCRPDLTLVFDVTLTVASARLGRERDRLESQPSAFHRRVRDGFLKIAVSEPGRVKVVDGARSAERVFAEVKKHLDRKLRRP